MKGRFFQFYCAVITSFGQGVLSMLTVWPSYTASLYMSDDTPLSDIMSTSEESLLGSLPFLGAMAGTAAAGWLIDTFGRRNGGVVISLPFVISWLMIASTTSMNVILMARFLAGIAGGASLVYAPVYISEVAEDSFRGTLASLVTLMYCVGILISYIFGWFLSYMMIIYANLAISAIYTLVMMTLTESPVYLMKKKRYGDARNALGHYRGRSPSSDEVRDEFLLLKHQLMPLELNSESDSLLEGNGYERIADSDEMSIKKVSTFKSLFFVKSSRRAFWVVLFVMSTQVLMGTIPVQVYSDSVFEETDAENRDLDSVIFAVVLTAGSLVPAFIADKVGRRVLIISSSILVTVSLTALALLLQFHEGPSWLSMMMISIYCFSLMYGASSVPYVLLAEVFVSEVQNLASILIIEWVWFLCFIAIAIFPFMMITLGAHGTFYCFALVGLANTIYCFFKIPETKGLAIEQIQQIFEQD